MSIVTDNTSVAEPKDKEGALFKIYSLFLDESGLVNLKIDMIILVFAMEI